ncbi:MAG TPA: hypothetical protein VN603_12055 [Candidatus Acidoferrales bacterium]|nr:hypothetical protein [Candidatus Acidoferrales bacterium]
MTEANVRGSGAIVYLASLAGSVTVTTQTLGSSALAACTTGASSVAIDSVGHFAFLSAQLCSPGVVGVATFPGTSTSSPSVADWGLRNDAGLTERPALRRLRRADGDGRGQHAGLMLGCGVLLNKNRTFLAIVDLNGLLAARPRGAGNHSLAQLPPRPPPTYAVPQ